MGARGPKKKTHRLDRLEGNPSRRKRDTLTPSAPLAIQLLSPPPPPDRLDSHARELWRKVAELLVTAKVLTTADLEALSVLCDTWSEYLEAKVLADADPYFETEKGYIVEHPAVRRMHTARDRLDRLWSRFGLTPSARQGMDWEILPVEKTTNVSDFAKQKGASQAKRK